MIQNYLVSTLRTFRRHRGNAALNIAGLAVGLASSALILIFVQYELSFDGYHSNAERIYRIYKQDPGNIFLGSDYFGVVPGPLAQAMKEEFPEVEQVTMFRGAGSSLVEVGDKVFVNPGSLWGQTSAFEMFEMPFLKGDPKTALDEPNTLVLTEKVAAMFFGADDPIGKIVRVMDRFDMRVTGVMRDLPGNTHIGAPMLLSLSTLERDQNDGASWENSSFRTFVLLREGADADAVRERLPDFTQRHMGTLFVEWEREATRFYLQPLSELHLRSIHINFEGGPSGDVQTIVFLSALAVVLLGMASINYMNLATARSSLRAREVGIRKVAGAARSELARQFIGESVLTAVIAGGLGLLIVESVLPEFGNLVQRALPTSVVTEGEMLLGYLLIALIVGVVSGSYPAYVLSGFTPAKVLKGESATRHRSRLRDALVVLQFASSIALAVCAAVILGQLEYIRSKDPGYRREQIITSRIQAPQVRERLSVLRQEVLSLPSVDGFVSSTHLPVEVGSSTGLEIRSDDGVMHDAQCYQLYTDQSFQDVYGIQLKGGRFLSDKVLGPEESPTEYVVNETFARTFGLRDPVGKSFARDGRTVTIIGVVKDFHMHSFRQEIAPLMIANRNDQWVNHISIRLNPGDPQDAISDVKKAFASVVPDLPIEFAFLDDTFNRMYERDSRLGTIVSLFTLLALFIGSMGLLGLATFVARTRRKEIGIRKVLGASSASVAAMLSKEFIILVGVANVVAWPVAYVLMDDWLDDFAYRMTLDPVLFVVAGLAAAFIALVTVNVQAARAARANPVESLRYE